MKKVIITGASGQDGSYMIDYLLKNTDYEVIGCIRRKTEDTNRYIEKHFKNPKFRLAHFDLTDVHSITSLIKNEQPNYFINFAAQTFVGDSWQMPTLHFKCNAEAVLHMLEAVKNFCPKCKFYSAGTSEQFGDVDYSPQDLNHPYKPRSPYGAAKVAANMLVKVYRESYGLYAVHSILFNHESSRRPDYFVSRKITKNVARIAKALQVGDRDFQPLELGNLDAKRDWSHAEDFVEAVWLMLNQEKPKDYLLASGETHTVREFVELAFDNAGIQGYWSGEGINEVYKFKGEVPVDITLMRVNPKFYRPAEVELLLGDPSEAEKELGWKKKIDFETLVCRMSKHDFKEINAT